ncbi:MAG TPA: Rieske 2Fe-2S domain-containing protein, partial [Rugosibacter sp.]
MISVDDLIDQTTGAQRRMIYADQAIYEQELERIFGRCWLFLAHESQVPDPGDFFRTYMGEDEVVVVRQDDRSIKVFLNTCTHRGNRLTRADRGNARAFSCNYHGWAFGIDGSLATVPLESEVYFNEIDKNQFRLVPVERVDSYHGLIFGCFDKDAPSLA